MGLGGWSIWRGSELTRIMNQAARAAVFQTCDAVVQAGKGEVPLDEGTLRNTGVAKMSPDGKAAGCACFGGGPSTGYPVIPYAIRWHEKNANFQHGRKRFYLRDPFNRLAKDKLLSNLRNGIGGAL